MRRKVTVAAVERIKPGETLWDTETAGFGVRARAGGARVYCVHYQRAGRKRWATIGRHGAPWTPETARREAKAILGEAAKGGDPASQRAAVKRALTVQALADRFLAEHVRPKRKPSTARTYADLLRLYVVPALGRLRVGDVARSDVARLHHDMAGRPGSANRALRLVSKMLNWATKHGLRAEGENPARHVELYPERKRERFLSTAELAKLATAIDAEADPYIRAAVRLLIFTGARLGEILGLRWEHVDLERGLLLLPDSKTGAKAIFLNAPAVAVLSALPRVEGNPHVVVGGKTGASLVNLEKPWRRIRARAGLADVRLHDLRHSFASVAAGGGFSLPMIGKLLGHSSQATTARYAHLAADPVRDASERVAERIAAAMRGDAATVVKLRPMQAR
jgi:integrase